MNIEPITPAYGRDYKSLSAVQEDFNKNKDFQIVTGSYINRQDIIKYEPNLKQIRCRYDKLRKTGFIKI